MPTDHSDDFDTSSVPGWLRWWAVVTLLAAAVVLVLGALITTFGVGMSDPVWPTEPWFLATNGHVWADEPRPGFLIEHTHRLAAWAIGLFAVVLAVGAWQTEPDPRLRRVGTWAVVALLVAYLGLHSEMRVAWQARQAGEGLRWPAVSGVVVALTLAGVGGACLAAVRAGSPGRGFRAAATAALVAVMAQGLLGGYRVFLNQLVGTQLAAIHGAFGQATFALVAAVVALAVARRGLPEVERRWVYPIAVGLLAATALQLVWGVWVRHLGSPLGQRLHILTAFVVVGLAVWAAVQVLSTPAGRDRLGSAAYHLLAVLAVQVSLGVEAYVGKFVVAGPAAQVAAVDRRVTPKAAAVRTAHTLIGAAVLASATVLVVRTGRPGGGRVPAVTGRTAGLREVLAVG